MQVFLNVTLSGGVLPSTIASPSVGLLLRLSVACFLGVSPAAVALTAVTTTAPGVVGLDLAANDAVNSQPGDCSAARAPLRTRLQRQLDTSTAATTTAYLAVHACREAGMSAGDPSALGALLASLVASTNSSSAALSPFLDAVARDSGISRTALSPIVAVGLAGSSANSVPAANPTSGNAPASALAVALSVVGLLLLIVLCMVCLCLALRRRKRQREEARKRLPMDPPAAHGVNPVHPVDSRRRAVAFLATADPVAAEPDLLLAPGAAMLPWKGNPAFKPASETTARRKAQPMPPRHSFTLRGPASAVRDGGFSQVDPFLGTNPLRSPLGYRPQGRPAAPPPDPSHSSSAEDARAGSTLRRGRDAVPGLPPPPQPPAPAHVDTGAFMGENPLRKRGAAAPLSPLSSRREATVGVAPGSAAKFSGENPIRRTGLVGHGGGPPAAY